MDKQREIIKGISATSVRVKAAFRGISSGVRCIQGQRIQITMSQETVQISLIKGVAGFAIYVGNQDYGYRIVGTKPWGGGKTVQEWTVNKDELVKVIKETKSNV